MTRPSFRTLLVLTLGLCGATVSHAAFPTMALQVESSGELTAPVSISHAGDGSGRLFICDQKGMARIIQNGMLLPTPFLDLTGKVIALMPAYDERGLLGLAFHPNYSHVGQPGFGKFYVFYSAVSPNAPGTLQNPVNCRTTISEFQVSADPNVANAATERILLSFDKPQLNHNGGELVFGPDGYLYISTGDGGGADDNGPGHTGGAAGNPPPNGGLGNAQDLTRYMGKLLRIDPLGNNGPNGQYGIPADNPFVGVGGGVLAEIYAYGLRNPWRASFDDGPGGTNRLFLADVGQNKIEEVNIITKGGNYGWRHVEGIFDHDTTSPVSGLPLLDPIAQYLHPGIDPSTLSPVPAIPPPTLGRSICGGFLYRGSAIPAMQGKYIFGDYDSNAFTGLPAAAMVIGIEETSPGVWSVPALVNLVGGNPLSTHMLAMGRDEAGEIYLALQGATGPQNDPLTGLPTGGIYKIVPGTGSSAINPTKDNSVYAESGSTSNALGNLFAGRTAQGNLRRALLAFDLTSTVPPGATINSAQLTLTMTIGGGSGANNMSLYPLGEDWGEGTSAGSGAGAPATPGDATWTQRFYNATTPVNWATAGGTFSATSSATTSVGTTLTAYNWTSAAMATDVQGWLNTPSTNFGWLLRADETVSGATARAFGSRESAAAQRPQLQINYTSAPALTRRQSWLQQYFVPGHFVSDTADLDGDGISNLLEYAFAFSPLAPNPPGSGFQTSVASIGGGNNTFTITFRRDPRATDLTYTLQTSSDLVNWTTIAQSVAGAVPTGSGFVSETDAVGEAPVKVVTAQENIAAAQGQRFARLQVTH